jgi:hypothetical protein
VRAAGSFHAVQVFRPRHPPSHVTRSMSVEEAKTTSEAVSGVEEGE